MPSYKRKIEKGRYRYITDEIDKRFHTSQPDWAKYAAVLHKLAAEEVDYHDSGRRVADASEMLDRLSGDCQDQTVFLSNLYVDAGLDVRVVAVRKIGENQGHVLPQVGVPASNNEASDILRETYEDLFNEWPSKMTWTTIEDQPFFLADPEWSDYVGDRDSLVGSYIQEDINSWDFHKVRKKEMIRADRTRPRSTASPRTTPTDPSQEPLGFVDQLDIVAETIAENI